MNKLKKIMGVCLCVLCLAGCFVFAASASETATDVVAISADDAISAAQGLFGQITQVINFGTIGKVLGIGLGAVLGIWLAWWGLRKLFGMLQTAIKSGRIKL